MTDHQALKLIIFGIPLAWLITALIVGAIDRARATLDRTPTVSDEAEAWLHGRSEVYDWSRDEGSGLA